MDLPGEDVRSTPRSACVPPKLFDEPADLEAGLRGGFTRHRYFRPQSFW